MYKKIQNQLAVLNTKLRFFGKVKVEDHLEALDQIGELGSPYDVQHIFHHVFSDNELISRKTAKVIRKLLTKREIKSAWPSLYKSFSFSNYTSFNQEKLKKFEKFTPVEAAHLYGVASLNHNGYVREKALDYLQDLATIETLPYILLRLNDWVPQVQVKAKTALEAILPAIPATELIKYHNLFEWLGKTRRVNLQDVQCKIFSQLRAPVNRENLFTAMQKGTLKERFFCWKVLTKEIVNDPGIIDRAISDPAPEIRQWAARHLPQTDVFKDRLNILLKDNAVRVRYAALKAIPRNDFEKYTEFFETATFDDSKPIREYARFVRHAHGDASYADQYRQKIFDLESKANPGLVAGIAETGTREDIALLKGFVDHKNPKIRSAALAGLKRLGAEDIDNFLIQGIQDSSAKVRNVSISILRSGYNHLRPDLEELLKNGNIKSREAALKVLMHHGVLDSLNDILFALTEPCEELQKIAWQYLTFWHHKHAVKLWFHFSDHTYKQTLQLLGKLQKENAEPPDHARVAWDDLPNIMQAINIQRR